MRKLWFCLAAFVSTYATPTWAQLPTNQLITLFGTGLDNSFASLASGDTDSHWTLVSNPGSYGTSLVVMPSTIFPISTSQWMNYSAGNGTSRWLVPNYTLSGNTTHAPGNYTYRTTFTIPSGVNLSQMRLFFRGSVDNSVTDVLINGASTGNTFSGFSSWSSIRQISTGFVTGTNTLDFLVNNAAGTSGNPVGLRVELSATIPEPATAGLLTVGFLLLSSCGCRGATWRGRLKRDGYDLPGEPHGL